MTPVAGGAPRGRPEAAPAPAFPRPPGRMLSPSFFARPADEVAPELVGMVLWREGVGGGRLVEVEAYLPEGDPACHAHRGRTRRNGAMFGPPGTIYVYLSYGVHFLLNLVCEVEGRAAAVLVRAFEPLGDTEVLAANRGLGPGRERVLAAGPGRVGRALGIDLSWDGAELGAASGLAVWEDGSRPRVEATGRIGVGSGAGMALRYILAGSGFVSRPPRRGSPVATAGAGSRESGPHHG